MKKYFGLRGETLSYAISLIAGCDFLLFGYDQGVMGGILTMPSFLNLFPVIDSGATGITEAESTTRSTNQGITVASYNLGCFIGAILTIFIGNPLGRKRMIIIGTSVMILGAALQASATTLEQFIIGRIITGIGNGGNTSTVPTWQSETSKAHKRGKAVMIEGALIAGGIMISNWVDLGFSFTAGSVAWRFPIAFQCFFCILILLFVGGLPESPRWLVMKGRDEEAREVLAALQGVSEDHIIVHTEFVTIKDAVEEMSKGSFRDLFRMNKERNLHRSLLAYLSQVFQQLSGCNLITYYAPVICKNLGMSNFLSLLIASCIATQYFAMSWPAVFLVERVGRRKLLILGAAGQAATMAILAGVNSASSTSAQIAAIVFLFVFNTFFALGWLGIPWLYPAEIVPLRIRAPANALSTSANWIFNFLVVMITPIAFNSIRYQTYIIFAVINAFMVPMVYFLYPETAYRSLEEMDTIFHNVGTGWKGFFTVVQAAKDEPLRYGKNGETRIEDDEEKKAHKFSEHRETKRSSGDESDKSSDVESARGGLWANKSEA